MNKLPINSKNNQVQVDEVIFDEEDYNESDDVSIGSLFSSSDSDDDDLEFTKKQSDAEDIDSRNYVLIEYNQNLNSNILQSKSSNITNQSNKNLIANSSKQNSFILKETQSLIVRKVTNAKNITNDKSIMFKINNPHHPLRNKSTSYLIKTHPVISGNIYRQNSNYISVVKTSNNNTIPVNKNDYLIRNVYSTLKLNTPSKKVIDDYQKPQVIYSNPLKSGKTFVVNSKQNKIDFVTKPSYSRSQTKNTFEHLKNENSGNILIIKTPVSGTSIISKRINDFSRSNSKNDVYQSRNTSNKILLVNTPEYQNANTNIKMISNDVKSENAEKKKIRMVTFLNAEEKNSPRFNFTYENAEKKYLFPYINFGNHYQNNTPQNHFKSTNNLDSQTKFLKIEQKNRATPIDLDFNSNSNQLLFRQSILNKKN